MPTWYRKQLEERRVSQESQEAQEAQKAQGAHESEARGGDAVALEARRDAARARRPPDRLPPSEDPRLKPLWLRKQLLAERDSMQY